MRSNPVPANSYGVLQRDEFRGEIAEIGEAIRRQGYATLDSGMSAEEIAAASDDFNLAHKIHLERWGETHLKLLDEHNTIRAPLLGDSSWFRKLPFNHRVLAVVTELIAGRFILNQQNAIINPARQNYSQGAWHRDLPYQHFVSSMPLAINALFCMDDFTLQNGATYVLPGSHKAANFPTSQYIEKHAVQIEARAGQYILLDCMLFHSGGLNQTDRARRAVNHVYTIPYFKQQINLPRNINPGIFNPVELEVLGFGLEEPLGVEEYLHVRQKKRTERV